MSNNLADPRLPRSASGKVMDMPISLAESANIIGQVSSMLKSVVDLQMQLSDTKSAIAVAQVDAAKANNRIDALPNVQQRLSSLETSVAGIVKALAKAGICVDTE